VQAASRPDGNLLSSIAALPVVGRGIEVNRSNELHLSPAADYRACVFHYSVYVVRGLKKVSI